MKAFTARLMVLRPWSRLIALLSPLSAAAFTYVSTDELHLTADLDGDGRADIVIVDRATGAFRVGYQVAPGDYKWAAARASGIQDATGADAGRLLGVAGRQELALTGPEANRVSIVEAASPTGAPTIVPVHPFTSAFGPEGVAVLDIPGLGASPNEDLLVSTMLGSPGGEFSVDQIRNLGGGTLQALPQINQANRLIHLSTVKLTASDGLRFGALMRGAASDKFVVWNPTNPPTTIQASVVVPDGGDFAFGRFSAANDRHHFLFFRPGTPAFLSAPVSAGLALANGVPFSLGRRIINLAVVPTLPTNRLLVSFNDASEAVLYSFDGASTPVELQKLKVDPGEHVTGLMVAADGSVFVYAAPADSKSSAAFRQYSFDGTKHVLKASGKLPALNAQALNANVFLFAGEPFVAPVPVLVKTLNAADWSSKPDVSGANVKVFGEKFGTSSQGLDNPTSRDLGPKPAGVTHALPNQYAPPISVASFQPAIGDAVVDFAINPLPGAQNAAINVTITALTPGATVVWRTAPSEPWSSAAGVAIFPLYSNSTVEYFGRIGLAKSRIHDAAYQFPDPPAQQDSDGDGVPDFVELAKGLNPNGGADSDGDGYTDKDELLAGTNPLDVNLPPTNAPIAKLEENSAFNLFATPRPLDGFTPGEVAAKTQQQVHLHRLDGSFAGTEETANYAAATLKPAARFADAPADTTLFLLSVATESHFAINSAGPSPNVGREVLGFVPVPSLSRPVVNFTPTAAPLATQADAWILAAKAAYAAIVKPTVQARFGVVETLSALLLERKVEQLLVSRGSVFPPTNRPSLFPFRPNDVTRQALSLPTLASLESLGDGGEPAWNLGAIHAQIGTALAAPASSDLLALANDIYRISSLSNNAAPGQYPLPVDVLRAFLDTGLLHSNYLAAKTVGDPAVANASARSAGILIGLTPRPTNSFDLEVTATSFQPGVTTLKLLNSAATKNLFVAHGVPFKFPDSFSLLAGSHVRVLAFTDFDDPVPGEDLQVISAELIAIPEPTFADSDGDFLPDAWECAFLGGVGDDSMGDFDGDGVSNLQEYFDGTDPKDAKSAPAVVVNLAPPPITVEDLGNGKIKLKWSFPAQYADNFQFFVQVSEAIGDIAAGELLSPTNLGNGQFELELPIDAASKFFLLQQLKPESPALSLGR